MCASQDPELHKETLDFILTKARDQDCMYFFAGLKSNFKTRRLLVTFFREHYDRVSGFCDYSGEELTLG